MHHYLCILYITSVEDLMLVLPIMKGQKCLIALLVGIVNLISFPLQGGNLLTYSCLF